MCVAAGLRGSGSILEFQVLAAGSQYFLSSLLASARTFEPSTPGKPAGPKPGGFALKVVAESEREGRAVMSEAGMARRCFSR